MINILIYINEPCILFRGCSDMEDIVDDKHCVCCTDVKCTEEACVFV